MGRTPRKFDLDMSVHHGSGWLVATVVGLPGVFAHGPDMATLTERAKRVIARRLGDVPTDDVEVSAQTA